MQFHGSKVRSPLPKWPAVGAPKRGSATHRVLGRFDLCAPEIGHQLKFILHSYFAAIALDFAIVSAMGTSYRLAINSLKFPRDCNPL